MNRNEPEAIDAWHVNPFPSESGWNVLPKEPFADIASAITTYARAFRTIYLLDTNGKPLHDEPMTAAKLVGAWQVKAQTAAVGISKAGLTTVTGAPCPSLELPNVPIIERENGERIYLFKTSSMKWGRATLQGMLIEAFAPSYFGDSGLLLLPPSEGLRWHIKPSVGGLLRPLPMAFEAALNASS